MGAETANTEHLSEVIPLNCSSIKRPRQRRNRHRGARPAWRSSMTDRTCSARGCDGPVNARGWCGGHYRRWRETGDIQEDVPLDRGMSREGSCLVGGCGDSVKARGWCQKHYRLWRLYGDPEGRPTPTATKGIYSPDSKVPRRWADCPQCGERTLVRLDADGYCSRKCQGAAKRAEKHPNWSGDDPSYKAQHDRVKAVRGRADHCERCGKNDPSLIYHWANLTGNYNDIWDFAMMCPACHGGYDAHLKPRGTANKNAKLTDQIVAEARRRASVGDSIPAMSREYGVSDVALRNAITRRTWKHVA